MCWVEVKLSIDERQSGREELSGDVRGSKTISNLTCGVED